MPAFIIQDKYEDEMEYIVSAGSFHMAAALVAGLEAQDYRDRIYEADRYTIREREYCYHDFSSRCGNANNCICMLESPALDCPLNKRMQEKILAAGQISTRSTGTGGAEK